MTGWGDPTIASSAFAALGRIEAAVGELDGLVKGRHARHALSVIAMNLAHIEIALAQLEPVENDPRACAEMLHSLKTRHRDFTAKHLVERRP